MIKNKRRRISLSGRIERKTYKVYNRVPHFMYLTDFREESLKDVIMQLETGLFTKVTGLEIDHLRSFVMSACLILK